MPKKKTLYEQYQEAGSEVLNTMQTEYDRIDAEFSAAKQKLLDAANKEFFDKVGVTIDKALEEGLVKAYEDEFVDW